MAHSKEKVFLKKNPNGKSASGLFAQKGSQKQIRPVNLKIQLLAGFIIPIFIVIFVGISAYHQAADGLIETYETSTFSSIGMASQLIDFGLESLTSDAVELSNNSNFLNYVSNNDGLDSLHAMNNIKDTIVMKQISNDFTKNIHIVPNSGSSCLSTAKIDVLVGEDVYDNITNDISEQCSATEPAKKWASNHTVLDEQFGLSSDDYAGSVCTVTSYKNTIILMDLDSDRISEILSEISLGENSAIAYLTPEGKEISPGTADFSFVGKDYAQAAFDSAETSGKSYITENGIEYLYMYSKCTTNNAVIFAIVPKSVITAEADNIRTTVIFYVIAACLVVGFIGILIILNLQRNMNRITGGLVRASHGDLTVNLNLGGRSEFAVLAKHVMETVGNTKNLISSVQHTTMDVSASSDNVGKVTDVIQTSVEAISDALEEINSGVSQEANDAEECLQKMDALSGKILHTSDMISEVESLAEHTKRLAQDGSSSMESLIEHSMETSDITETVNSKVDQLIEHSMKIEEFVSNINDIADQTTLLSLNASIEAARAGEMGRGFTVVAEEIKKLSENSMESAQAIKELVSKIHVMTDDTKAATQKSQAIVKNQQEMVAATKQMFLDMNQMTDQLLDNMKRVSLEIQSMDADRADTLNSIQNISGVIEETLASTTIVSEKIKEQVSIMDGLTSAAAQLNDNTSELNQAVGKFTL